MSTDLPLTDIVYKLMRPEEVASLLGISKSFVYRLLKNGAIPVVRLGRACRIRPQDLLDFIESNLDRLADASLSSGIEEKLR